MVKVKGLLACALVCALLGGVAGTAGAAATHDAVTTAVAKKKPPAKKKHPAKKKPAPILAAFYDCAKYITAARFTALAGGWGGTYTDSGHYTGPDRASWGPGGNSACEFKPSNGYGGGNVVIYWGAKNASFTYAGTKKTAEIRGSQRCTNMKNQGQPLPADPRMCGPVAIPGLGDQAFAVFDYIMVLRGPIAVIILLPEGPDPTGNLEAPQDTLVSMATAIMASIPLKPPA